MENKNMVIGEGVAFQRIRRVTGYLVGDYKERFNDGKRKECEDRVKHTFDLTDELPKEEATFDDSDLNQYEDAEYKLAEIEKHIEDEV